MLINFSAYYLFDVISIIPPLFYYPFVSANHLHLILAILVAILVVVCVHSIAERCPFRTYLIVKDRVSIPWAEHTYQVF